MHLLTYQFFQHAIIASLLASVVCGIIGVIIVEKRLLMMSGGIAHTSFGGVGLGYLLGFEPIIGAFAISIAASLGIGFARRKGGVQSDVAIGMLWSLGMALGVLFIALAPGYPPDLSSYLFGNILTVTRGDLWMMTVSTILVASVVFVFFSYWKAYLFDEEFAAIRGIPTAVIEYALFIMIAISVVVLIRVVGVVLILALFTAPPAIAGMFQRGFRFQIGASILLGLIFCLSGLYLSYLLNLASGASIVIVAVLGYIGASLWTAARNRLGKGRCAVARAEKCEEH